MHDLEGLIKWFRKLKDIRKEYEIVDTDINNIDETVF